jgi:SAM-dependent methyltransferase
MKQDKRLFPPWHDAHYYGLIELKRNIIKVIGNYFSERNDYIFLDYGCGSKPYEQLYKEVSSEYLGADLEENDQADIFIDQDTGKIDIEDNYADGIISTQVLEHVEDPPGYLKEAYRVCKSNGILIISTHGFFPYHPNPQDYWRWTGSGLKKILRESGWEVVQVNGIIGYAGVGLSFLQYSLSGKLPKILRVPFEVVMQRLIILSDKLFYKQDAKRTENCVLYVMVAKKI